MKYLIFAMMVLLGACSSMTAPTRIMKPIVSKDGEPTCRSGYHIAYRDGVAVCEQDGE
jgi:hypothetical protein